MRLRKIKFSLALILCSVMLLQAQQYSFISYTPKEGLVNSRARSIWQDSKGRLYISTYGGLSVYEGSRFINYTADDGLTSNTVNDMVEMGPDSVWLIPNSPNLLCLSHGRIKPIRTTDNFYPVINQWIRCTNGISYAIADQGLFRFESNHFTKIPLLDAKGRDAGLLLDHAIEFNQRLIIRTDQSLRVFPGAGSLIIYDLLSGKFQLYDEKSPVYSFTLSPDKELWMASRKGLFKLDPNALAIDSIRLIRLPKAFQFHSAKVANGMMFDDQHNLWMSTNEGVYEWDPTGHVHVFSVMNGLPANSCTFVLQDKENIIWVANEETGIAKLVNRDIKFYPRSNDGFQIADLYADGKTDSVWFFDKAKGSIMLKTDTGRTIYRSRPKAPADGQIVMGKQSYLFTRNDVYRIEFFAGRQFRLNHVYHDDDPANGFRYGTLDSFGNLVIASRKLIAVLPDTTLVLPLHSLADQLYVDSLNRIWIESRASELYVFRIREESHRHFFELLHDFSKELPFRGPMSIVLDKNGNVWIGTGQHGLIVLFLHGYKISHWKQLTIEDGLDENFINYLHCDGDNYIYAGTPTGLDKIRFVNNHFEIDNISQRNNIYQYIYKIKSTRDNGCWAWIRTGILEMHPKTGRTNSYMPELVFSKISSGDQDLFAADANPSLSYKENDISFYLSATSFINEKQIRFSYLLEGSGSGKWSRPSIQSEIHFADLSPGEYILRARAVFLSGIYPERSASFAFRVLPPWWHSWWFRILLVLATMAAIGLIAREYYRRKMRKNQQVLERQRAIEKERTRIATDMHDDLGSGLSRIRFLSESIRRKKKMDPEIQPELGKISQYSREMIEKMGEIVWALNQRNDTVADLFAFTRSYAVDYLQHHELDYAVEAPAELPVLNINGDMRRNIFLSVKECLFNIIKHANASKVSIVFEVKDSLRIIIRDDGVGIDWDNLRPHANGLHNIRRRMESICGQAEFLNDQGTTVRLTIPLTDDR